MFKTGIKNNILKQQEKQEQAKIETILKTLKPIRIYVCKHCDRLSLNKHKWHDPSIALTSFQKELQLQILKSMRKQIINHFKNYDKNFLLKKGLKLTFPKSFESEPIAIILEYKSLSKKIRIEKSFTTCDKCLQKRSKYYEAIIQLRTCKQLGKQESSIELEKLLQSIENILKSKQSKASITKIVTLKKGFDVYITSYKTGMALAKQFAKQKHFEVKTSKKLHTYKDGKRIYKFSILLRICKD